MTRLPSAFSPPYDAPVPAVPAISVLPGGQAAGFSVVCLSPQPWEVDLPTNRQQIMKRLARRGHRVLYVETGAYLGRHLAGLADPSTRRSLAVQLLRTKDFDGIDVRKAVNAAPWGHSITAANAINSRLTAAVVRRLARRLPQPVVLWLYDPCAAGMIGACGEQFAVYDCVDDYSTLVRSDPRKRAFVAALDEESARRARVVFTTTTALYERHSALNENTQLVGNVGDYDHFAPAANRSLAAPEVRDLSGPVIGFVGNFLAGKVDFDLLHAVATRRPEWTLLLLGPARPDTEEQLAQLNALSNVRWLGAKRYEDVPGYVAAFDVGLCPYVWNDYTRSVFPLKLYEYLAAGKPVVASGTPDLQGMEPDVLVARGADEFVAAIDRALTLRGPADRWRRIELASRNTWETRTQRLVDLISEQLA